jgi:hypothetical protein
MMASLNHDEILCKAINLSETFRRNGNRKSYKRLERLFVKLHDSKRAGNVKELASVFKELAAMLRHFGKIRQKGFQ